jgi:hypothetical protein
MALAVPLLSELTDQDARAMGVLDAVSSGDEIRVCWPGANLVHDITGAIHVLGGATDQDIAVKRATDLRSEPVVSVDPLRRLARADWESADSVAALRGARVSELWHQARLRARVFDAAQLIGLADRMTALAVAYSLERKQFGKAIGANQAVKHQLANVQIKIEFARPVVYAAAAALPSRLNGLDMDERPYSAKWLETRVHHALVAACDAADLAARTAIQVHGAMGYSWELDLQFYAKRSWVLAGLHGGRSQSFAAVHRSLVHDGLALGPDRSFG